MRKSGLIFILLFLFFAGEIFAQRFRPRLKRHELVFGLGATNFLGDLGGANQYGTNGIRDLDVPAFRPVLHVGYLYQFRRRWGIKTNLYYARLAGNDQWTQELYRNNRNLHFRSPIIELSSQFEFSIISGGRQGRRYFSLSRQKVGYGIMPFSWYVFAGMGGFYFNPRAQYNDPVNGNGKWYSLRKLSTEGQGLIATRKNYSLIQVTFPVGMGIKYFINNEWAIGFELGRRFSFTDYLDDASKTYVDPKYLESKKGPIAAYFANPSPTKNDTTNSLYRSTLPGQQRADPKDKDAFMYGIITVYYKLARYSARLYRY